MPSRKRMRLDTGLESFAPNASIESLPSEVMKNIFNFVGKGNYCFIAPVSKDFCYNYLTMDVIEDSCNHKLDYLLAIQRNKITTTGEAASLSSEAAEHCFLYAPKDFQRELCAKAALKGRKDIVTMAEALGVDFEEIFSVCEDSLKGITEKGDLEMLKLLEEKGLDLSGDGHDLVGIIVACAALHGHLDILKWLHKSKHISTKDEEFIRLLFEKASRNGHLKIIQWAKDIFKFKKFQNDCISNAAIGGQVELVKWFRSHNISWNFSTLRNAVQSGNKALIEYLLSHGWFHINNPRLCEAAVDNEDKRIAFETLMYMRQLCIPWDQWTCSFAARNGNLEALIYARNNGCPWDEDTLSNAVDHNHIDVVKYCLENRCPTGNTACYYAVCNAVCQKNHRNALKMLKLLRQYSVPWDVRTCNFAAGNGNLEALQFARAHGCPWNEETLQRAIVSEDIATIQYCIENGCPFDNESYNDVMYLNKDCFRILRLLQKNGHKFTEDACAAAAGHADIKVLRWLKYIGCPWDERTCHEAVKAGEYDVLVYAHENGCPWSKETFAYCFSEDGLQGVYYQIPTDLRLYFDGDIFNYLRENNCPQPDASDWQINR